MGASDVQLADTNGGIDITRLITDAARKAFETRYPHLDQATLKHSLQTLQDGLNLTFAQRPEQPIKAALEYNALMFAAFKNHHQTTALLSLLTDPQTGMLRSWHEFRQAAIPLLQNYNVNWLKAEYQTAVNAGLAASRWQDYERDRRTYPFLTYITMRDQRVRDNHRILDRTTRHIDDAFWNEYFPPNGWNCRCSTKQARGPETPVRDHARTDRDFPMAFRINPGKTGMLVNDQHPYYTGLSAAARDMVFRQMHKFMLTEAEGVYLTTAKAASEQFHYFRQHPNHIGLDEASGGFIVVHQGHQWKPLAQEMPTALLLRARGEGVYLIDDRLPNKPDMLWKGEIFDIKHMHRSISPKKTVKNYFEAASKNKAHVLIHLDQAIAIDTLKEAIYHGSRQYASVKKCIILRNDGKLITLDRDAMRSQEWPEAK